jgi:glycine cleavage system H protein
MPEPEGLKYTKSHEWARIEGDTATIGITQHAEEELGDVALLLAPEVGLILRAGEKFGEIESIKAVSDLYAPVSGTVAAVNESLVNAPELVNDDPYGEGWMIKIKMSSPAELDALMDNAGYDAFLGEN